VIHRIAMPFRPCPNCAAHSPRLLESASKDAFVWYVRCEACGHVWSVSKDANQTVRDVTERRPRSSSTPSDNSADQ